MQTPQFGGSEMSLPLLDAAAAAAEARVGLLEARCLALAAATAATTTTAVLRSPRSS